MPWLNCCPLSCVSKASDGATDTINLGQKVPLGPPTAEAAPSAAEEEKVLPEWSEKVAQGILTGKQKGLMLLNRGFSEKKGLQHIKCTLPLKISLKGPMKLK